MQYFVYTVLLYLFAPVALAVTALRGLRDPAYRDRLPERLGFTNIRFAGSPIWVHAVSVGEVQAAAVLIRALRTRHPAHALLVTTATPTGAQRVRVLFGDSVRHCYLPYDLPGAVDRFLSRTQPRIAIVMETEIWPNLFRECGTRDIPILLASARLSEKSANRYRRLAGLLKRALTRVTIAAQSPLDADRFRSIGADAARVHVSGNVKFDLEVPGEVRRSGESLRASQFPDRAVWVAGSTHEGEENIVLDAHERVRAVHKSALLVLAPRHPSRFEQVRTWLKARGASYASRSRNETVTADTSVLLVDTLGELLVFYAAADVAFVGGSLAPIGGHNLVEPAALARPVIVGPHNFNAPDIAQLFRSDGAALEVASAEALAAAILDLLANPARRAEIGEKGRAIVESNRGALDRVMQLIDPLLQSPSF